MSSMLSKGFGAALLCFGLAAAPAFAQTQLTISASPNPSQVGQTIGLDVMISNVQDLAAFQFSLNFDPTLLQANSSSEGSFLSSAGSTVGDAGSIDNTTGIVSYAAYALTGMVPGANGSGVLIHMSFTALAAGTATLSFSDAILLNSSINDIAFTAQPANLTLVTVVPEPASLGLMLAGLGFVAWRRRGAAAA